MRPLDGGVGGASIDEPGAGLTPSAPEPKRRAGLAPPPPPPAAGTPPADTAPAAVSASFASAAAGEQPMPSPAGADDPGTNAAGASLGAPAGAAAAPGGRSTASSESAPGPKRCKRAEACQAETLSLSSHYARCVPLKVPAALAHVGVYKRSPNGDI